MAQHLTLKEVKEAARAYYHEGRLTAQHPNPDKRDCVYFGSDGCRCAIGAALDDGIVLDAYGTLFGLSHRNVIKVDSRDELEAMYAIQEAHDDWCVSADELRPAAEAKFCELIGVAA